MREILLDELKKIQLDILIRIHDFCMQNGINYSLSSGTLIGAIRHKGYIPWDDDIDIYMLRPDFDKFERDFSDPDLQVMSPNKNVNCIYPYGKVYDSRTLLIEDVNNSMDCLGVNIDVFVIDSVPDNINKRKKLFRKNTLLENIMLFKIIKLKKNRKIFKNLTLLLGRVAFCYVLLNWLIKKKYNLCIPYNSASKYICNVMAGGGIKSCIPHCYMSSFIDVEFETHTFRCMKEFDKYLRQNYGNYMKLPPKEEQISTHSFKAYWK